MKKKGILLTLIGLLLLTGCNVSELSNTDLGKNIKIILSQESSIHNVYFEGYKYYVPRNMHFVSKDEYNAVLKDEYHNQYYLYVDIISYFHGISTDYTEKNNIHYSKRLSYDGDEGYIEIQKVKDQYFVQMVYHYGKMEAYTSSRYLVPVVSNMCTILNSLKFHRQVVNSMVGEEALTYKEEAFVLFPNNDVVKKEDFLDVVEQNESDAYKKALQEDEIELDK